LLIGAKKCFWFKIATDCEKAIGVCKRGVWEVESGHKKIPASLSYRDLL